MNDAQIYIQLREFMDRLPTGFPETPNGVEIKILRKLFSPEEADLFMKLSMSPENVDTIARRIGSDAEWLGSRLEQMARKGLLFRTYQGDETCYQTFQFIIGLYEFQLNTIDAGLAQMIEEYIPHFGMSLALSGVRTRQLRVVPVQSSVATASSVAPYNRVRELVLNQDLISLQDCICKKEQGLLGNHCDRPHEVCFAFGDFGKYYIDNGLGRRVDGVEALAVIDKAEAAGLVLCPTNSQELAALCCCCSCCCPYLRFGKMTPRPREMFRTEYAAVINPEVCSGCGTCLDRCQMDAIEEQGETMTIREAHCIGCGLCVSECPESAISLIHTPMAAVPPATITETFDIIRRERGIADQV